MYGLLRLVTVLVKTEAFQNILPVLFLLILMVYILQ